MILAESRRLNRKMDLYHSEADPEVKDSPHVRNGRPDPQHLLGHR